MSILSFWKKLYLIGNNCHHGPIRMMDGLVVLPVLFSGLDTGEAPAGVRSRAVSLTGEI